MNCPRTPIRSALFVLLFFGCVSLLIAEEPQLEEEIAADVSIDFSALLAPEVEALSLLQKDSGKEGGSDTQDSRGTPLCSELPAVQGQFGGCTKSVLLAIAGKQYEDADLDFLSSISLLGQFVQGDSAYKRVLFSLLLQRDEGLEWAALTGLRSIVLSKPERLVIRKFITDSERATVQAAIEVISSHEDLEPDEVRDLKVVYDSSPVDIHWPSDYQMVVEAFTRLQGDALSHLIDYSYDLNPMIRAWIAESLGRRGEAQYEEELTQVFFYSKGLLQELAIERRDGQLHALASLFEDYPTLKYPYLFSKRDRNPEEVASRWIENIIDMEELVLTRVAYALFAIGTESAVEKAAEVVPLVERRLDTAAFPKRVLLADLMCSLPELPVDLRRDSILFAVKEKYLEAETIINCLSKYRDPELLAIFKTGLDSELPTIEAASLKAIFAAWDTLPSEERSAVCKHQELSRIASSVNVQNLSKYCS